MSDLKLFQITEEDKDHYKKIIHKIDVNNKEIIIKVLGEKIQKILNHGCLNKAEVILIEDMGKLSRILEQDLDLPKLVIQKILFAMSYFIDENDEIPDIIPEYGYLDDLTVVNWVMEDIQKNLPEVASA